MVGPPPPPPPPQLDGSGSISAVYQDILQSHILTRLDGPTLAALSCASSDLHALSTQDLLWKNICTSTWPSINHPLITTLISMFPSGHRSFFSDSYPLLLHHRHSCTKSNRPSPFPTTEFITSAVDIYYKNVPIFSKVQKTETETGWFLCSPFRVDLLDPKEFVPTSIQRSPEHSSCWLKHMEDNVTLSWILIDPTLRRAVNISSKSPVSVERHWLTGEVVVKFGTILLGGGGGGGGWKGSSEKEYVECQVAVTLGGNEGGEVHIRDVSMGMEDMEGKALTGKDSLDILREAMEIGERRKGKLVADGKVKYMDFLKMKREFKERKQRRETILDWACILTGLLSFLAFWSFIFFR